MSQMFTRMPELLDSQVVISTLSKMSLLIDDIQAKARSLMIIIEISRYKGPKIAQKSMHVSSYRSLEMDTSFSCAHSALASTMDVASSVLILAACLPRPQTRQLHPTSARRTLRDSKQPPPDRVVGEDRRAGI
jgi:hypothetical protein